MLIFNDCGKFTGTWERGVVVNGEYAFKDGLLYEEGQGGKWKYCNGEDRRFFSETIEGLRPAGDEQITNEHPAKEIPQGMFDIGRGYFNPTDGNVYSYEHELIGQPNVETEEWIRSMCRKG